MYLIVAIICEVIATSVLKKTESFTKPLPSLICLLGYVFAFYFLSKTLKTLPVGVAYAVWSGLGIALVTLVAWFVYGQTIDTKSLFGMGLIVAGVIVINLAMSLSPIWVK